MREPRPRHTLQVIRVPSLEVQNLGLTSFDRWLDENGYDKTNAGNNRTIWAREGGWHLKRCRNLKTGTDDFWFIAFDGKGGNLYPLKTQRDYRAAYRKLEAEGYAPAVIEQMTTGAAYNLAYPRSSLKQAEMAISEPMRKPDVDIMGEHCERVVTQRSGVAQGKFKVLLIENFSGRCAITGCFRCGWVALSGCAGDCRREHERL
ncbi:hypothetical protein L8S97_21090 [Enterobacter cloacae]|uniref:hypothetical protein n=1 Tax=Enterobacter cloacae TaxID=550 RepID=UPI002004D96C|nr:hypothetical protein [Enterobacter cloacae]MCK6713139.1 hypothetical protein [Enterobacter cloacae]